MENFNRDHPELREGEVFVGNMDVEAYSFLSWKTKRKGEVAYNMYGRELENGNFFPVFVQRAELKRKGLNPDNPFGVFGD